MSGITRAALLCTVRGCGELLETAGRSLSCGRGHSFDVARSGYVNLLQAQDRKSPRPGDSDESREARRRILDAGFEEPLAESLRSVVAEIAGTGGAILDAGCGEGWFLRRVTAGRPDLAAHGLDISAAAVDVAARRQPDATLVVANIDRGLPFADGSFTVVLSVNARVAPEEMRRVLREDGRLVVAVPASDDLAELRLAVLGEAPSVDRMVRVRSELEGRFVPSGSRSVRHVARLDAGQLRDALALTYRAGRSSRAGRIDALEPMDVTLAHDVAMFRPAERNGPMQVS